MGKICSKIKHKTAENAYAHARKIQIKRGDVVHPYQCTKCNGWHVGGNWETKAQRLDRIFERIKADLVSGSGP